MTITMDAARLLTTSASSSVFILASSSPIDAQHHGHAWEATKQVDILIDKIELAK